LCGQNGVAGTVTGMAEQEFQKNLIYNSTRGIDSTGAASVKRDNGKDGKPLVFVAKEIGNPYNLFDVRRKTETDFGDILAQNQRALLGHCRAKTIGGASRKNAHPFYTGDIVGTHNGTLSHSSHKKLSGVDTMDTDSEAIFNEIDQFGIAETVKKFGEKEDAYALVWYNLKDNSINLLRNDKRPLWYGFSKDNQMMFWSSLRGHLISTMESIPHEDKYLFELPVDDHYSWEIPKTGQPFGKGRVVKRAQVIIPFTYQKHDQTKWNSSDTLTDRSGYYSANSYGSSVNEYERYDRKIKMYRRYNLAKKMDEFSLTWGGPYFSSTQECWDSMTDFQREERISTGAVPVGVTLKESDYVETEGTPVVEKTVHLLPPPKEGDKKDIEEAKTRMKDRWLKEALNNVVYPLIHHEKDRRIYWDCKEQKYLLCIFTGFKPEERWKLGLFNKCPSFVPFKELDINANHLFVHEGKKQKKRISYKGFGGLLLARPLFESLMADGCLECSRVPHWGNSVAFINKTDFLCEHCSRSVDKTRAVREAAKAS